MTFYYSSLSFAAIIEKHATFTWFFYCWK